MVAFPAPAILFLSLTYIPPFKVIVPGITLQCEILCCIPPNFIIPFLFVKYAL